MKYWAEEGDHPEDDEFRWRSQRGFPDEEISATIDVSEFVSLKTEALQAQQGQYDNIAAVTTTADGMSGSTFQATVGDWCKMCQVKASCPAQPEGRVL